MTHTAGPDSAEVDVRMVHAVSRDPRDRAGRVAPFVRTQPRIVGVFHNTPWLIAGKSPVGVMLDTAHSVRLEYDDPCMVLEALFNELDRSMVQLASEARTDAESFEAMWEFGGQAALVAVVGGRVAIGRVGDLRVLRWAGGELKTLLAENTLAADLRDSGHYVGTGAPANIITDCLGTGAEPRYPRVLLAEFDRAADFVIISGSADANLGDTRAREALAEHPREGASMLASATMAAGHRTAVAAIVNVVRTGQVQQAHGD